MGIQLGNMTPRGANVYIVREQRRVGVAVELDIGYQNSIPMGEDLISIAQPGRFC